MPGSASQEATPASRMHPQRILLVEDSEPAIIQITDILAGQGYEIAVARNGREALAQIALAPPDALILDLMMPEVDGFAVLRSVRGAPATAQLPVLILTARHVTREELSFLKGNHIQELIQKGDISKAELLAAVAKLVALARVQIPRQVEDSGGAGFGVPSLFGDMTAARPSRTARASTGAPTVGAVRRDGKPVILVVEDNLDNLRTARALLSGHYRVIEATDGGSGVAQARAHHPDLILMDITMPVLDGIQALAVIRDDETLRDTPVIALTASAMIGDREAILAHGFDGYLTKPIDAELLAKTIREALDNQSEKIWGASTPG